MPETDARYNRPDRQAVEPSRLLVLFYGIGMAAALVGTGLLLVLARDRFERWSVMRPESRELPGVVIALRLTRALPILTAVAVIGVGGWIAIRSLMSI